MKINENMKASDSCKIQVSGALFVAALKNPSALPVDSLIIEMY
jgi:hypothetical protein